MSNEIKFYMGGKSMPVSSRLTDNYIMNQYYEF